MTNQHDKKNELSPEIMEKSRRLSRYALGLVGLGITFINLGNYWGKTVGLLGGFAFLLGLLVFCQVRIPSRFTTDMSYIKGLFLGICPPFSVPAFIYYLARGSRRMAFQSIVIPWSSLVVWMADGLWDLPMTLFYLLTPLITLRFLRGLEWPKPRPLPALMSNISGGTVLTIAAAVVVPLMLAAIYVPGYIKYTKRSRTSDAVDHARYICSVVIDWTSASERNWSGKGGSGPKPLQVNLEGEEFSTQYPDVVEWLENGDDFYHFQVQVDGDNGSSANNPVVLGKAKGGPDDAGLYGAIIQAGGTGVESGKDLAECKANVEKVSSRY